MLGAFAGDIIGSIYERYNIKSKDFTLFTEMNRFTDDSVMTAAIAEACCSYGKKGSKRSFKKDCIKNMKNYGLSHINAGYGGTFIKWLLSKSTSPYNSFGNGSAMRVSPVGWTAKSLAEAEELAKISAEVTHNHPYGIAGAQAVAAAIFLLKNGSSKEELRKYIESKYYDLNFTIDEIRDSYEFDVTCQGSVPQAIVAFLDADSFEDTIRNAISIGGDSDTIGAIAGSIAEAYYGVPEEIKKQVINYLDEPLLQSLNSFYTQIVNKNISDERYNSKNR